METKNPSIKVLQGLAATEAVKEHFTLSNFNREYDMYTFIMQCSKVRKLQKKFYACKDKSERQQLLLDCKREEATQDKLGNFLWQKYKLGDVPASKYYRIG